MSMLRDGEDRKLRPKGSPETMEEAGNTLILGL